MGLNIFIIVSAFWFGWFELYSRGLLTAQQSGPLFSGVRVGSLVRGDPEPSEAVCVGTLDGRKVQAVGWIIRPFVGKKY